MGVFDLFKPNIEKMAADRDIDGLIFFLQHDDPEVQIQAAKALLKIGPDAQPKVIGALWHESPKIRRGAAAILGRQGGIPAKALIGIMYAAEEDPKKPAGTILRDLGEPAVTSLIQALDENEPGVREGAVRALVLIGEPAQQQLASALMHQSFRIRSGAAEALRDMQWRPPDEDARTRLLVAKGDWTGLVHLKKPAVPYLIQLLSDQYYGIRKEAAAALGRIMDLQAVPHLVKALGDADPSVQLSAVDALSAIGDRKAVSSLVTALGARSYAVRMGAANALDRFGWSPEKDTDKILYCIAKEQWQELTKMGAAAIPALIRALGDEYYGVRTGAAGALYDLGPRAKEALVRALNSENPEIRRGAAEVLKRKGDAAKKPRAVPQPAQMSTAEILEKGTMKMPSPGIFPGKQDAGHAIPHAEPTGAAAGKTGGALHSPGGAAAGTGGVREPGPAPSAIPDTQRQAETGHPVPRESEPARTSGRTAAAEPAGQVFRPLQKNETATAGEELREEEIRRLIVSLKDEDENVRVIAAEALGKMGEPAVLPLIGALNDPFYQVRIAAADILGELSDPRAVKPLSLALKDGDEEVRTAAARALGKIGDMDSVIPLLQACKDEYPRVSGAAVDAIALLGIAVAPILIKVLQHDSPRVRSGAAAALGKMQAADGIEPLIALFRDPDGEVNDAAARALVRIGNPAFKPLTFAAHSQDKALRLGAITALAGFGEKGMAHVLAALNDSDPDVKGMAASLVRRAGAAREREMPGAVSGEVKEAPASAGAELAKELPLTGPEYQRINLITEPTPLIRMLDNQNKEVQIRAAQALVAMGERAVPSLIEAFADENRDIRTGVAETLVAMGSHSVMPLIAALQDPRPDVRTGAARTLGRVGDTRAVNPLIQVLGDANSGVRIAAAEALGYVGSPVAVEPLILASHDPDGDLQRWALRALGYIGDERAVAALTEEMGSDDYSVRTVAIEALVEIGRPSIPSLVEALSHPSRDIRTGAAECLALTGWTPATNEEKIPFLIAREEWIEIAGMGGAVLPALGHFLSDADVDVRMGAVTALSRIGGSMSVEPLIRALGDEDAMVRRKALGALIEIGEPAVEALQQAGASAGSPAERQAVHQAIERIRKRQAP